MENMFEKMANQGPLRDRAMKILRVRPRSIAKAAKEIGISHLTLARFLKGVGPVAWTSLCKIEDYVLEHEKEYGL